MQVDCAIVSVVVAVVAAWVSLCSLWLARTNWREANRPLVSVFIDEVHASPSAQTARFDLCVSNTGNRPAVDVCLAMSDKEKQRLRDAGTTDARFEA